MYTDGATLRSHCSLFIAQSSQGWAEYDRAARLALRQYSDKILTTCIVRVKALGTCVAVVFDEEEQESDEEEGYEIRDESDDEEEGVEGDKDANAAAAVGEEEGEDALVIGGASSSKASAKAKADKDIISPHFINSFWVQHLVSEVYTDPQTASPNKTIAVLSILGSKSGLCDCENQLMELFDYQSYSASAVTHHL